MEIYLWMELFFWNSCLSNLTSCSRCFLFGGLWGSWWLQFVSADGFPRNMSNIPIVAWVIIPPWSCSADLLPCSDSNPEPCCAASDNRGWRVYIASLGLLTLFMFVCRFFLFHLYESPKYLLSQGRSSEAVAVVQSIARYNGTTTWLTEDIFDEFGEDSTDGSPKLTIADIKKRNLSKFSLDKLGALFVDEVQGRDEHGALYRTRSCRHPLQKIPPRNFQELIHIRITGAIMAIRIVSGSL